MHLLDDLRLAWRGLAHVPGFLAVTSGVFALGLGATIFMYALIHTTMQKAPPFEEADRLIGAFAADPARDDFDEGFWYPDYVALREQQRTLEDMLGFYNGTMILSGEGLPERYSGGFVTANFFDVLRVKPALGRTFRPEDEAPNAAPVVVLGHDLWRTRFNSDPTIIGRTVRVNSRVATVIGIAPPRFDYPTAEELWIPIVRDPSTERRGGLTAPGVAVVGRLKPGVTLQQAADDLAAIMGRLAKQYPATNAGLGAHVIPVAGLGVGENGAKLLYTMFAAVWLVLLIACANVASLIFVRANSRVYEASMRVALGARRPRLVRQMLGESIVIGFIGLCVALALAAFGLYLLELSLDAMVNTPPRWWEFELDFKVAAFGAGAALFAALVAGLVPALRASRPDVMRILRDGGRTGTGLRLSKFTATMVVVEVALSVALLTGAGLMMRSALVTLQQDIGVDASRFMTARIGLPEATYPEEARGRFAERLVADLENERGVEAAAVATAMPGAGASDMYYAIDGKSYATRADYPEADYVVVSAGFFEAFQMPLIEGRDFNSGDRLDTTRVAVVNQEFVRLNYGGASALGRRIQILDDENAPTSLTIVGVVPNVLHDDTWEDGGYFPPTIYQPITQQPVRFMTVAVRAAGELESYATVIREAAKRLDADLAAYWVVTLPELQNQNRAPLILLAQIFTVFAAIAAVLAAVGIYGVLSFATGQRTREIGVRRALGARDRQILKTVMRSAGVQLAAGLLIGALLAPLVGRSLGDSLQGLSPDDPTVYTLVFGLLIVAAMLASWVPAVRALRVQPATALRWE